MATEHAALSKWQDQLLPHTVDHLTTIIPTKTYAEYPLSSTSYEDGYWTLTFGDFANAINGLAWWLHEKLGPRDKAQTLAYIGPNDFRYPALVLAANKAGYQQVYAQEVLLNSLSFS